MRILAGLFILPVLHKTAIYIYREITIKNYQIFGWKSRNTSSYFLSLGVFFLIVHAFSIHGWWTSIKTLAYKNASVHKCGFNLSLILLNHLNTLKFKLLLTKFIKSVKLSEIYKKKFPSCLNYKLFIMSSFKCFVSSDLTGAMEWI